MATAFSQIGKQGITDNFIESLKNVFKNHESVRISVLKSGERGKIRQYAEELVDKLGKNYTARVIGFVIIMKKWRKNMRE